MLDCRGGGRGSTPVPGGLSICIDLYREMYVTKFSFSSVAVFSACLFFMCSLFAVV
jgi:hypothetical protein